MRNLIAVCAAFCLLANQVGVLDAKGGGGGGFGGGGGGGRASFSGNSFGGGSRPSYSGSSSSSFGGGSSSRPSYSGSSGSSFGSSSSSSRPSYSGSSNSSSSSGSKPSYSSGSNSRSSYSGSTASRPTYSSSRSGTRTVAPTDRAHYDAAAARRQAEHESAQVYQQSQTPKPSYTTARGDTRPLNPASTDRIRSLPPETYSTRPIRHYDIYHNYYAMPAPPIYNDPFGPFFWLWLMDRPREQQAQWAYNHHDEIDPARYQALLNKDAALSARVKELEKAAKTRDQNYTPPGLDYDLMYDDNYTNAAYNPTAAGGGTTTTTSALWVVLFIGFVAVVVFSVNVAVSFNDPCPLLAILVYGLFMLAVLLFGFWWSVLIFVVTAAVTYFGFVHKW